jgi:hypothetical protein
MTKLHRRLCLASLAIALLSVSYPAFSQEAMTVEVFADGDVDITSVDGGPLAGPIEVFAHTEIEVVLPGGFGDVACAVENLTADTTLTVIIEGRIVYSDGITQTILRRRQPEILAPESTLINFIFFAVPVDAAPGTATFYCTASAARVTGGTSHGDYVNPIVDSDRSEFVVLE